MAEIDATLSLHMDYLIILRQLKPQLKPISFTWWTIMNIYGKIL